MYSTIAMTMTTTGIAMMNKSIMLDQSGTLPQFVILLREFLFNAKGFVSRRMGLQDKRALAEEVHECWKLVLACLCVITEQQRSNEGY
jgi:hypothetical protein